MVHSSIVRLHQQRIPGGAHGSTAHTLAASCFNASATQCGRTMTILCLETSRPWSHRNSNSCLAAQIILSKKMFSLPHWNYHYFKASRLQLWRQVRLGKALHIPKCTAQPQCASFSCHYCLQSNAQSKVYFNKTIQLGLCKYALHKQVYHLHTLL